MEDAIKDIPQDVVEEARIHLKNYHVPISILLSGIKPHPVGSGTLVEVNGIPSILTAAHVWNVIKDSKKIGLVITDHRTNFTIDRENIATKVLGSFENTDSDEWGPDLSLLQLLNDSDITTLKQYKSFLNLAKQKVAYLEHALPDSGNRCWVISGMVGESIDFQTSPGSTTVFVKSLALFFRVIPETHEHDGYDYLDFRAKLESPDVPSSFEGFSGGGLWEVQYSMKSGINAWDKKLLFRGVEFGQKKPTDGSRVIRCHGPQSIFQRAWNLWGLP